MEKNECLRCGNKWIPRTETRTKQCPHCRNTQWDQERTEKIAILADYERHITRLKAIGLSSGDYIHEMDLLVKKFGM